MKNLPTDRVFDDIAKRIGCDPAAVRAVFEVEAAGKYFNRDGSLPQRFEPHHFPRSHWSKLGFAPGNKAPWRASLALSERERRRQFAVAQEINKEGAAEATSWGAPQIMGFNHDPAGFSTALKMVASMEESADNQVLAFFNFVMSEGLDGYLRAHDWFSFASRYNGNGKAADYAAKIASAYRRHSGGKGSPTVLRVGASGANVEAVQSALLALGYLPDDSHVDGSFGVATKNAVMAFQRDNGLKVDGVVGHQTLSKLQTAKPEMPEPKELQPETLDRTLEKVTERIGPLVGGGAVSGVLATLGENAQTILVGGLVVLGLIVAVAYVLPRLRR